LLEAPASSPHPQAQAEYRQARRRGDRLALAYAGISALWILLSDRAVEWFIQDDVVRAAVSTVKGWLFVALTAALLLAMLRRWTAAQLAQRERELADRHLLEVIAENSSDAIAAKDREGRYLFCNPAALRWLGKEAAEVLGHDDYAVFPAAQAEALRALDRGMLAQASPRTREVEVDTALGRRVFLSTRGPLRTADGTVWGVFGISRDITERKRAEEVQRDREHKLQAIVMHSPSALSLKDREGRYVLANPNVQRLLHRAEGDIVGRTDFDLFPPEVAAVFRANDEQVLHTLQRHSVEETVPVQGQPRLFMSHMFPVLDEHGTARYVCRISLDVTERRRAEQALTARNEELERFNRVMVGRELDMIELKRQVNALSQALGRQPPYPLEFDTAPATEPSGAGNP
jgi:PAS domain S-box-containing protein